MNKKFLIIGGIILIIAVSLFFIKKKEIPLPTPFLTQPTIITIPSPILPSPVTGRPPTYTISMPSIPSFPDKINSYAAILPQSILYQSLAQKLGFSGNPNKISVTRGDFLSWHNGESSLSIGGDPTEVSLNSPFSYSSLTSSEAGLTNTAKKYIESLTLIPTSGQLVFESVYYFAPSGSVPNELNSISGATLTRINLRLTLDGRPFYTQQPDLPTFTVKITGENTVTGLVAYWFSGFSKIGVTPIISVNEAITRLTSGGGIITYLYSDEDKNDEELPSYRVSLSTINSVELGYYYTSGVLPLAPIFVFRGTGIDKTTGKTVKTTTVVPALP